MDRSVRKLPKSKSFPKIPIFCIALPSIDTGVTSKPRPGKIGRRYVATSQASILSLWKCYERTRLQLFADPCNFLQILSASPVLTAIVRPRALCRARRPIIHQIEAKTNHHTTYFRGVTMEIVGIITYPVDMEAAATTKAAAATIAAAAVTARWFGTLARCGQPRHVDGHSDLAPLLEIPCNPCTSRLTVKKSVR